MVDEINDEERAYPEECPPKDSLLRARQHLVDNYEPITGSEFLSTYVEHAERSSQNNELMHTLMALVLTGQALHRTRIIIGAQQQDCRIHGMVFQASGTGKGPAFSFMKEMAERAGMDMSADTSCTTAGLIGTIAGEQPVLGPAYYNDIVGFQEASTIFHTAGQTHSADLINVFNQVTDVGGNVSKRLGTGRIQYRSHCSLIGTTYPPESRSEYIATGFLPRMASAYQPVGLDFYWNVWDWLGDNLNAPIGVEKNTLERLACTLARIHQASDRGIVFEFDAKHEHKATRIEANKVMQEFDESVAACSRPFISRVGMYNIKFAIASAAWNLRSKVLREDWEIARALTISMWGSILKFISHYDVSVMNRDQQKMHDWICESIRDGQEFVKQRDVLLRFRAIPADKRKKHLQDLVEMGALVENRHISDKGGRPSIRYTLPKRGL